MSTKNNNSSLSFVSSIFKFSISTWVNAILYAAAILFVNLFIDKSVFGMYDLTISAATTLMSVATLGFDHAYIRFFNEPPKGAVDHKQVASLGLIVSSLVLLILSAVIIFIIPSTIGNIFFEGHKETLLLTSMCITTLCMIIIRFFNITYRMNNNILMFSIVSISLQFFTRIFFIFGALIKDDFSTITIFNLIGLVLFTLIFFLVFMKDMIPKKYIVKREAYAPLFKYSLGLMPSSVLLFGNQLVNKLFISATLGDTALGLFAFASLISQALSILQGGFANFWSAYMFGNYKEENERIKRMHDLVVFVMMVLMCLLILMSPLIFIILSRFSESIEIFGLLLYAPLLTIIAETTVYGIEIAKKTFLNTLASLLCFITNILFCMLLVPQFKILGAALALVLSTSIMFIFRTVFAQRLYRTIESYLKTTVSLILMASLSFASYLFGPNYLLLFPVTILVLIVYIFMYMKEVRFSISLLKALLKSFKNKVTS